MAAITREPYERVYMTRVFPEGDGSCRFELFVQRVVEIDGEDFYAKKAAVIKTKRLEDLAGVELAAGGSAGEIWGMVKEMSGEKLSVFTIRSPKSHPYVIEVVNEAPDDGKGVEAPDDGKGVEAPDDGKPPSPWARRLSRSSELWTGW